MSAAEFCFIHAADLHLDTPFEGIAQVRAEVAEALRDASLAALDSLVELALQREAAFVVLAGDIYDGPQRGVRAQLRFARALARLSSAGVQAFIVHGNHDPAGGWSAIRSWPPGVTVFPSTEVGRSEVVRHGRVLATVYGISYAQPQVTENLALRFSRSDGEGIHVGVLHCNAAGSTEHEPYCPCSVDDLKRANMDYWALGHIHRAQILSGENPWIVYPGNLQGRSPKSSEQGEKGAVVVEVSGTKVLGVQNVALDAVRFLTLRADVAGVADLPALRGLLREKASELLLRNAGRALVLRAVLEGRSRVVEDLRRRGALEELLADLREEGLAEYPFVWWDTLLDRTQPLVDLEAVRRRNDFSSDLLRLAEGLCSEQEKLAAFLEEHLRELPENDLLRFLDAPCPEDPGECFQDAVRLALEILEESTEEG